LLTGTPVKDPPGNLSRPDPDRPESGYRTGQPAEGTRPGAHPDQALITRDPGSCLQFRGNQQAGSDAFGLLS